MAASGQKSGHQQNSFLRHRNSQIANENANENSEIAPCREPITQFGWIRHVGHRTTSARKLLTLSQILAISLPDNRGKSKSPLSYRVELMNWLNAWQRRRLELIRRIELEPVSRSPE